MNWLVLLVRFPRRRAWPWALVAMEFRIKSRWIVGSSGIGRVGRGKPLVVVLGLNCGVGQGVGQDLVASITEDRVRESLFGEG